MEMTENLLATQQRTAASLAKGPWRKWVENVPPEKAGIIAYLMENQKNWMSGLDEDTRLANIGSYEKFVFPMIKAVYANLVASELVSVQPMQSPTSLVFYKDVRAGTNKGRVKKGDSIYSARTGWNENLGFNYSAEIVEAEQIGVGDASDLTPLAAAAALAWTPIRPGSITISYTASDAAIKTLADDGAGGFTGAAGELGSGNTINYATGAILLTFATAKAPAAAPITATYDFNSEGSSTIPQVDIALTSTPVFSRARKLATRWSIEAAATLKAVHGMDAEVELVTDTANEMRMEVDREIINDLINLATANHGGGTGPIPETTFAKAAPTNISIYMHRQSFAYSVIACSNGIFKATRRHQATWILCGINVANIIMGQEGQQFQSAGTVQGSGVQYVGTFQQLYKVYMDPYMDVDTAIMGYRGDSFLDAGFVYAPWIPFYATPTIYLDDFLGRKGILSHYGKKPVNGLYYARLRLT